MRFGGIALLASLVAVLVAAGRCWGCGLVRFTGAGFSCSPATRTCTIATLAPSSPVRIDLSLLPTETDTRQVSAKATVVGATDPVPGNNTGKLVLAVKPAPKRA